MASKSKKEELEEKLSKLYKKCKEMGLSDDEILTVSLPLQEFIRKSKRNQAAKKYLHLLICTALLICIIAIMLQCDPVYRMLCVAGRLLSITTLSIYDWTDIYFMDCALYNPYFLKDRLTEEDCETCQDVYYIEDYENLDPKNMTDFLFDYIPIVVTDALDDWRATKEFNLEFIKKLYSEDKVLATSTVCSLVSDTPEDFHTLIQGLGTKIPTWNIRWSNCEIKANKILRHYFNRPYFLPDMVQVLGSWIFMSSGTKRDPERAKLEQIEKNKGNEGSFNTNGWKKFGKDDNMQWMAQIRGQYAVSLTPVAPCNETCRYFNFELNPGEILIFTPKMWIFEYMPYGEEDAIALASMGDWE